MTFAFDETWNRPFAASPFRLRFELGGEEFDNCEEPVPRFMQALTRARLIREASFERSSRLWAIARSRTPEGFASLREIGFRGSPLAEWRVAEEMHDNSLEVTWQAFDVTGDQSACDTLLWSSIASEMPIEPKAQVDCYLADLERGILLHVYDDRGMDLTALARAPLLKVLKHFDSWILPYDRDRIEAVFNA